MDTSVSDNFHQSNEKGNIQNDGPDDEGEGLPLADFKSWKDVRGDDTTQITKNITSDNGVTENQISNSFVECSDHHLTDQNAVSQLMNTSIHYVASKTKSGDNHASEKSIDSHGSISMEQLEEPDSFRNVPSISTASEDTVVQSERNKNVMSDLPEVNSSKDACDQVNSEIGCTPIILSVRGNATDIDCFTESSTIADPDIPIISTCSNTPPVLPINCRHIESTDFLSHENNQKSIATLSQASSCLKRAHDASDIASTGLNTVPSNTNLQLSTSDKDSGSHGSAGASMPAASLLQSVISKGLGSSGSFSAQMPIQSSKPLGYTIMTTSVKRSALTSTSKTSHSAVLKVGSNKGKDSNVSVPIPQAVKIILKGAKNSHSHNEKIDVGSLCTSIVNKMIRGYEINQKEGMTRLEVFDTKLLDPCKKQQPSIDGQFVCSICGDVFNLEEFYRDHLDRKTFELLYTCPCCKKTITFYNKCRFWYHVRSERPDLVDEEKLKNETSYFRFKPYFDLHEPETEKDLTCKEKQSLRCKFCHDDFLTAEELSLHLKRNSPYLFTCKVCSMLIGNKCALAGHVDIHDENIKCHVCPQCGEQIDPSGGKKVLFEHLDACFHFNTSYVMPCECSDSFATTAAFKLHFLKSHTKVLYRCHVCGSCFSSTEFLATHCERSHNTSPIPIKIVLCTLCKQGFQNCYRLKEHVEKHANQIVRVRKKVLKCFLCDKYFHNPKFLTSHVEKEHTHRPKRCTICFGLFESRQNLVQHIVSKGCYSNRIPHKLHVCLDMPSVPKTVEFSTYKDMFKFPPKGNRMLLPKISSTSAGSNPQSTAKAVTSSSEVASISTSSAKTKATPVTVSKTSTSTSAISPLNLSSKSVLSNNKTTSTSTKRSSTGDVLGVRIRGPKFQCHSCKISILGSTVYDKHLMLHKSLGVDVYPDYCSLCKKTVDTGLIQAHMEYHQLCGTIVCILCQKSDFNTMNEAIKHSKNWCYYTIVMNDGARYIKKNKSNRVQEDGETNDDGCISENERGSEKQSSNAAPIVEKATVFPCLVCGLAFTSKQEKEDHVSRFHDGTRTLYFCLVCKRKGIERCFSVKNMVRSHISRKHRIVNPSQITKSILMEEQNVASGQVVASDADTRFNGDVPPPKRLRLANEGEFMCGKCGFSSEDSKLFADHIVTHNPKKEPQCPECGLCFTVVAALKKHLFVVHKIKATDEYLINKGMLDSEEEAYDSDDSDSYSNGSFSNATSLSKAPKAKRTRASSKNTPEYECTVCHRPLSTGAALQKHMRNHGMAFIRSRRYDKT